MSAATRQAIHDLIDSEMDLSETEEDYLADVAFRLAFELKGDDGREALAAA